MHPAYAAKLGINGSPLDDILIYTEDPGQGHVAAVRWVLENLRKHGLFANRKKCRFHKDEVRFLGYVVSAQGVRIGDERIEAVKTWPELKSVPDIQVFIGFANFYRFIQGFSKRAAPLTSMLRTSSSTRLSDNSAPTAVAVEDDEVAGGGGGSEMIEKTGVRKNLHPDASIYPIEASV